MGALNERVRLDIEGTRATVTLTRPDKHNGFDLDMRRGLLDAADQLKGERDVRVVILRGEGPSFCAGLDFKSVMGQPARLAAGIAELWSPVRNLFQKVCLVWRELPVPVIAAIHGNCFGAGMQLALGADIRIARPDAKLSLMESKWGLIPDMGGTVLLREVVPIDVAKELVMTGRVVSGEDAEVIGLVTQLADDPVARALELAAEIETRSPDAVAGAKMLLQEAWLASEHDALAAERRWQRALMLGKNAKISRQRHLGGDKANPPPFARRKLG